MEMGDTPRWVLMLVVALVVVGLLAFARGQDHHRGQQVGAQGHHADPASVAAG
jgi:hypothetical protein